MTTVRASIRHLLRLTVVAAVAGAVLGIGPAQSQPGGPATMPHVQQTVAVPAADPPAPAPRGLATSGSGASEHAREGLPTVNAVTQSCPDSTRDESRLGLMQHTAMYSHCDYP
jgi:hypothetical protein